MPPGWAVAVTGLPVGGNEAGPPCGQYGGGAAGPAKSIVEDLSSDALVSSRHGNHYPLGVACQPLIDRKPQILRQSRYTKRDFRHRQHAVAPAGIGRAGSQDAGGQPQLG